MKKNLLQDIEIVGSDVFKFEENSIDIIEGNAIDMVNIRKNHINGNLIGFQLSSPPFFLYFEKYRADNGQCPSEEPDMPMNQIGKEKPHIALKFGTMSSSLLDNAPN